MRDVRELLRAIDPKNGDKFSPNLFRFVRNHRHWPNDVFEDKDGVRYVGFRDDFNDVCGAQLGQILSYGGHAQTWCYMLHNSRTWRDVDDFWPEYIAIGRCAVDHDHQTSFIGGENRYEAIDDTHRRCRWCGAVQAVRRWEETKIIKRERWEVVA